MLSPYTAEGGVMPNIRAYSMALFGEIDREAVDADRNPSPMNDAVLATVEGFLPHSTGLGQRDWYHELEEFLNTPAVREQSSEPYTFPPFADATEALSNLPRPDRSDPDFVPLPDDRHPALARAVYACVTLEKIRLVKKSFVEPGPRNEEMWSILAPVLDAWPAEIGRTTPQRIQELEARLDEIVDRDSFVRVATQVISEEFAECAKPCFGTLEDSGGQYCSTLYTDSKDPDLTVADIARIVHPLNWHVCCPTFFHAMAEQSPNKFTPQRWFRIVESISAEPNEYLLKTALIFSLENRDGGIVINYKLDPNRENEDLSAGIVEIDNGYIWVTPGPGGTGVRIRTSKEERVNGLSPTATAALGCLLGWADAGKEMFAGTARKAMKVPPELSKGTVLKPWPPTANRQPVDNSPPTDPPGIPATLPINYADSVEDAGNLLKSLVTKVSSNLGNAASRWMDGVIRDDVVDITTQMGDDLKKWSLEVYDTAERNVKPPKENANG